MDSTAKNKNEGSGRKKRGRGRPRKVDANEEPMAEMNDSAEDIQLDEISESEEKYGKEASRAIMRFAESMQYPLSKNEIIARARAQEADSGILSILENMPDRQYKNADDVSAALSGN